MRIWTLHPRYLDDATLREAWRDGLALRRRLENGARQHATDPIIRRLTSHRQPLRVLDAYLSHLHEEARRRGKAFDATRIAVSRTRTGLSVPGEWIRQDWTELMARIADREPERHVRQAELQRPHCHPAFRRVPGKGAPPWAAESE